MVHSLSVATSVIWLIGYRGAFRRELGGVALYSQDLISFTASWPSSFNILFLPFTFVEQARPLRINMLGFEMDTCYAGDVASAHICLSLTQPIYRIPHQGSVRVEKPKGSGRPCQFSRIQPMYLQTDVLRFVALLCHLLPAQSTRLVCRISVPRLPCEPLVSRDGHPQEGPGGSPRRGRRV